MAEEPASQRYRDIRRLLAETGREHIPGYVAAFLLLAVVSATTAATAWLMKSVINDVFIAKSQSALIFVAVAVMVIYTARGVASYGQAIILARIGQSIVAGAQKRLIARLMTEDVGTILLRTSSEIVQKQAMAVEAAQQLLNTLVTSVGRDVLSLIGLLVVILLQDPTMALVVFVALPIAAMFINNLGRRIKRAAQKQVALGVSFADQLRQLVQGFRVVKAFGVEAPMEARLAATIEEQRANRIRISTLQARTQPIVETFAGVAVALVILYGGWRVIGENATPGAFFAFITALLLAYDPARRLAGARVQLEQGLVGLRLFYEMLDHAPEHGDAPDAPALALQSGEIRLDGVTFAYEEGRPILDGLSLAAPAGKTLALVGGSGSGKSTVMSLILRFWAPQSGRITIDGQDIAGVTASSLRSATAYVGQDTFLFDGTIRENIALGREGASAAEIEAAARAAEAHEFILELPLGYDTPVGELASRLSGGQKQRIAIARAFLRNAPIVLLDEPTAALDARAEEAIRATLARLAKGRTTILIAHRLRSVIDADVIAVIDGGRVVEQGSHTELLAKGGAYARLHALQTGEA